MSAVAVPGPAEAECAGALAGMLESLLDNSQLKVSIVDEFNYCGDWFLDEPVYPTGLFHLMGEGHCCVEGAELAEALHLRPGDLVILPHGHAHQLRAADPALRAGASGDTSMICGELEFPMGARNPVIQALPACFVVRSAEAGPAFRDLAVLLVAWARERRPGRQVVMNKLADALFTLAVCEYASRADEKRGLFAALADPRICRVLRAIHERPGEPWSMQSLAALACMSRSSFAERFAELLRMPPMQYLTRWRVGRAQQLLQDRRLSVASVAERLGYRSEAAFRKLFKRVSGVGPGQVRGGRGAQA
jgi:AraC-like DNA-binding protein